MMGGMAIWVAIQVKRNYVDGRASGIGKVERVKRRIYKEIAIAQQKGIDLNIKYIDMPSPMRNALREVGEQFGWKQSSRSAASGKAYEEAYYNSLKRAYNAVSGFEDVEGVGAVYNVRNAEGQIVLTWNDVQDAADHVRQEPDAIEILEQKNANLRKRIRNRSRKLPVIYNMQAEEPANENEAEVPLTKQQQILTKVPYLKTVVKLGLYKDYRGDTSWDRDKTTYEQRDDFQYVVWRTVKNSMGEKLYEGAVLGAMSKTDADLLVRFLREAGHTGSYYTVKSVKNVNLNAISGVFDFSI